MKNLADKIKQLPPEQKKEIEQLVESWLQGKNKKSRGKPAFKWAGIAKDLRERYTSVELQHRISRWRAGEK